MALLNISSAKVQHLISGLENGKKKKKKGLHASHPPLISQINEGSFESVKVGKLSKSSSLTFF